MFSFLFKGRKYGVHLNAMHSGAGTRVFKKLGAREQSRWAAYDRRVSRARMSRRSRSPRKGKISLI